MTLKELIKLSKLYSRDTNDYMFEDETVKLFINQGIDRIRQFKVFEVIPYLENEEDEPALLPKEYHYILGLFASSRLYDMDERFYEGTQKRNEFEQIFMDLTNSIGNGTIIIPGRTSTDEELTENYPYVEDFVQDKYFKL